MWSLAALIPIVCCILIPAVIAVAAFVGLGKKKPNNHARGGELPQENLGHSTQLKRRSK